MIRLLLVEDEPDIAEPLAFLLRKENFDVTVCEDGTRALEHFFQHSADIVLLDLMLPGMIGMEVCRQIRAVSTVPIIMLTAKDSETDVVVGLELGADDYITKPYSSRELLARINSTMRRADKVAGQESTLSFGRISLNRERHAVTINGVEAVMPLRQFALLEVFMKNIGRVVTRAQLIENVWGDDYFGDTKTLDVHIRRIRNQIEEDPTNPKILVTIRGLGYRLQI